MEAHKAVQYKEHLPKKDGGGPGTRTPKGD